MTAVAPKVLSLAQIADLADAMKALPVEDCPVTHRFAGGIYVRELFVRKGLAVVTKVHRVEHPFAVMQGRIAVYSPEGGVQTIQAPFIGVTKPGTVRLAVALEDTVWVTFHKTDKTTPEEVEKDVVFEPREALAYEEKKKLA